MYYENSSYYHDYLAHHGVKGMKWGVRRYQNKDGSLNAAGKARRARDEAKAEYKSAEKEYNKSFNKAYNRSIAAYSPSKKHRQANTERWEDALNKAEASKVAKKKYKDAKADFRIASAKDRKRRYDAENNAIIADAKRKEQSSKTVFGKTLHNIRRESAITNKYEAKIYSDYRVAKAKAKKDPSYKKSPDYMKARNSYGKLIADQIVYGSSTARTLRSIEANNGKEAADRAKKTIGYLSLVSAGISIGTTIYKNRH